MTFTAAEIGPQTGRVVVVTGANSGLGFETAKALVAHGATVVAACRSREKGEAAVSALAAAAADGGAVHLMPLDLASLASIHSFAGTFRARFERLDLLVNNAGVMMPARRALTVDGFELQLGTNHLGHFALTGLLLDRLRGTAASRVVTVSSLAHRVGAIAFDDLQSERRYRRFASYGQSKLANLLFSAELGRRLGALGADVVSVAAHPGYSATNLQNTVRLFKLFNPLAGQRADRGALPTLYAATATGVQSGDYYGPGGLFELRGLPRPAKRTAAARDEALALHLWDVSEALTGVTYPRA